MPLPEFQEISWSVIKLQKFSGNCRNFHLFAGPFMTTAHIISLDAERDRRKYIAIARANKHWQQTRASFALSDFELDDDDAERAGRIIAGVMTIEEASADILNKLELDRPT
jgi:hypothetical protein